MGNFGEALRATWPQSTGKGPIYAHDAESMPTIQRHWLDHYTIAYFAVFGDIHRLVGLLELFAYD